MACIRKLLVSVVLVSSIGCGDDSNEKDSGQGPAADAAITDAGGGGAPSPDAGGPVVPGMDAGQSDAQAPDATIKPLDSGIVIDAAGPVKTDDAGVPLVPLGGDYILSTVVFGANSSVRTYVSVVTPYYGRPVEFANGLEISGQATIAEYGGKIFISDGTTPIVTRYRLDPTTKRLVSEGSVSFAKYGGMTVSIIPAVNSFISATKAYMAGPMGSIVVWDPTALTLTGEIPARSPIMDMTGLSLGVSSGIVRNNRFHRAVFWIDWSEYELASTQYFTTYDTTTDELLSIVPETRCPGLGGISTVDDSGTAYLTNWYYNLADTLLNNKPSGCALRLKPGTDTLDPDWKFDFTTFSGGHEGAQLTATGGNRALFSAFRQEETMVTPTTAPYDLVSSEVWETWSVNLPGEQAKAVTGIPRLGSDQSVFVVNGRTFLFSSNTKKAQNKTEVYEVKGDGTGQLAFTIGGWGRALLKLP